MSTPGYLQHGNDRGDTWQRQIFERLRASPEDWLVVGELFDEFRLRIPDYLAMRAVHLRYKEVPPLDKAQWLYFLNTIRSKGMGIERCNDATRTTYVYTDQIRIKRQGTCKCGGGLIKNAYGSNALCCLECGDISAVMKPQTSRPKKVVPFIPRQRDEQSPDQASIPNVVPLRPTPDPVVQQMAATMRQPGVSMADAARPVYKSERYKPALVKAQKLKPWSKPTIIEREPFKPKPVESADQPASVVAEPAKPQEPQLAPIVVIKNVKPEDEAKHIAAGGIPIQQLDKDTWFSRWKNRVIILYKGHLWTPRMLAKYVKTILPNFSLNRIEEELQRCGYRPAVLLAKYHLSDNIRNEVSIHGRPVESFQEFVEAMRGRG